MQKIIIAHQYYCPEHFTALLRSERFVIDYRVLDPFYHVHFLFKKRGSFTKYFRLICLALFNIIYLNFISGRTVIFALPPYHPLLFLFIPFLSRNKIVFFTSWPFWNDESKAAVGPKVTSSAWLRMIKRYAEKVACVNSSSYQYWSQYLPSTLVEHCIETEKYIKKKDYAITGKLAYIGRLVRYKNVDTLMRVVKKTNGLSLDVIGEDYRTYCHPEPSRVKYAGYPSKDWIQKNLNKYDALVLVSDWLEPYGIVLLEAMATGLPVLVTRTAGTETIFRDLSYEFMVDSPSEQDIQNLISKFNNCDAVLREKTGKTLEALSRKYGVCEKVKTWQSLLAF